MTFYCPKCWKEINAAEETCPFCNADILKYVNMDYEKKLLNALRHTEPETVLRAVNILGRLKSEKAVEPLITLFKKTDSTFLKIAILKTLNEIGVCVAREFVMNRSDLEVGIVKRTAKDLIDLRVKIMDKTNEVCSRIIGALSSDRCPVCAMLYQDEFDSLCRWAGKSGETYRDSEQRIHLVNAGGFCNHHFWQFQKISSHYGSANVCVDLLAKLIEMLNSNKHKYDFSISTAKNSMNCPLCHELKQKEADYLKELTIALEENDVKTKYISGCGVCMPHFIRLMDYSDNESLLKFLVDTQITQIARIKSDAENFIRKMNPPLRWEQTKAEKKSWLLAIEKIAGRNGV